MTFDELHIDFETLRREVRDLVRGVKLDIREARLEAREQYNRFRLLISPAGGHRGAANSGRNFTSLGSLETFMKKSTQDYLAGSNDPDENLFIETLLVKLCATGLTEIVRDPQGRPLRSRNGYLVFQATEKGRKAALNREGDDEVIAIISKAVDEFYRKEDN